MNLRTSSRVAAVAVLVMALARLAPPAAATPARGGEDAPISDYEYVSPVPGSRLVSPANDIVLRPRRPFEAGALAGFALEVTGSVSGRHGGRLSLSDDGRTLVFEPDLAFAPAEQVHVASSRGASAAVLPPVEFTFDVAPAPPAHQAEIAIEQSASEVPGLGETLNATPEQADVDDVLPPPVTEASVPSGYPHLQLVDSREPLPGDVFLSPFSNLPSVQPGNLTIVDGDLTPIYFRRLPAPSTDFKRLPDGRLSYYAQASIATPRPQFVVLDSSYAPVDSFATGNGYLTDSHDFQLLPDGHALLLAYDPEPVRMDSVVAGGRADAIVTGLIVQELDRAKRVVFQWRSWDHFAITDCASPLVSLQSNIVDYVHGNAVDADSDGALLISSRHLSEITKIDRRTGAVLWRMGPHATRNEFRFVDDVRGFSHQHDVRRLANGDLTLFDNGNGVFPEQSRAVEYRLDEARRVATEVWEYRRQPQGFGSFMGSVQRLDDGTTMVGWGGVPSGAALTELHADDTPALEVATGARNVWSYRAYVFPWRTTRFLVTPDVLDFGTIEPGGLATCAITITNPGAEPVVINGLELTGASGFFTLDVPPGTLAPGASATVRIAFHPLIAGSAVAKLCVVQLSSLERVAVPVKLTGTAAHAVVEETSPEGARATRTASAADLRLAERVENPVRVAATVSFTLPREEHALLEIFDTGGRRIATLVDCVAPAGEHVARWNATGSAKGIYFCRLTAGGESVIAKLARVD